jgi:hypothetical protein
MVELVRRCTSVLIEHDHIVIPISRSNGGACTLGCSGGSILSNFTSAGIGVNETWILNPPPLSIQPFCWWLISPGTHTPPITTPTSVYFTSALNQASSSNIFNISLHFNSNYETSQDLPCCLEKVLIYNGLPQFIQSLIYQNTSRNDTILDSELLTVFSGMDLEHAQLSVLSSFLTVVYFHPEVPVGFTVTVGVGQAQELQGGESEYPVDQDQPLVGFFFIE